MPSEQPPTRVESGTSIEEAERLAAIETDAVFGPAQPQPREGTQERYIDQWPKPMFLCTHCDEQTDSDPCQECASVFDERGENYPPVLRFQVVPAPPSEQPREGTRVEWRCSHCKEPVSGPNEFCGGKFGDKDHPPMARPERVSLEPASPTPTEQGGARVECPSCGSNHPRRKKRVQHSPGRPFASKWCDDDFHEPAPEGEGEAS